MSDLTPAGADDRIRAHAVRVLPVAFGRVRAELEHAVVQQRFTVTVDQLTVLEAKRDSLLGGPGRNDRAAPLLLHIDLQRSDDDANRTTVVVTLSDRWSLPFAKPTDLYQQALAETMAAIDAALGSLQPGHPPFAPVEVDVGAAETPDALSRLTARASGVARRMLDGAGRPNPKGWRREGSIILGHDDREAEFAVERVYALVTAGALIAQRPGRMPPALVHEVERLVTTLEAALQADGPIVAERIEVDAQGVQAATFLAQQASIREQLPLRTLFVCVTCRTPRVVNPDYQRLRQRNQRARALSGSLGLMVSPHGASPFVLVGRMMQLGQLDPDFVCARCQGLHAETAIVTFCPRCGEQTAESALRACAKCSFDFRSLATDAQPWRPRTAAAAPPPLPTPAPATTAGAPGTLPTPTPTTAPVVAPAAALAAPGPGPAPLPTPTSHATPGAAPAFAAAPAPAPAPTRAVHPPGWYPDYARRYDHRWFDGRVWTTHVSANGVATIDPQGL
ncbi:DUF2510 domain-containing protein [Subtercola sp. YIM 133946]|uniref:DUF2510 domain-containing protein n=1 Tax=Subtercola sp. YIM 133946 TaxID=3118909 RepID=UPI002F95B277